MHVGIFGREHVKVIWGHFGALFQQLGHNPKTACRRAKRKKIEVIQCAF